MIQNEMNALSSLLHLPARITVVSIHPSASELVIRITCTSPGMTCPECHQLSSRIHGAYQRIVADLPCAGRDVILLLTVRKFVCGTSTCPQRIFTERLPELVESYARMTTRLLALVQTIGLVAGGEMGTRLADKIGVSTTPPTLLRHVMKLPIDAHPNVRVLGVDDWSWKKGRRYGTILVDLERRKIIDLLPDRTSATFAKWLREHPEVEVISRDRGTDYAAAAREAAPQAVQIADRFHLVRNLADALQPLFARCRTEARQEEQERSPEPQEPPSETRTLPHPDAWRQHPPDQVERRYKANQEERETRFQQIVALRSQGLTMEEIGKRVGMCEKTVRRWLKQEAAPIHRRIKKRSSRFDPYAAFVLEQWQAGIHDGTQIYEAMRAQGFTGNLRLVQRFLQTLREKRRPIPDLGPPHPLEQCASRQVVWLFIRKSKDLTDAEQATLASLRQASTLIETIYGLVQDFLIMVREQQGERLDAWLDAIQASQIPELQRFAQGIRRDKEAVVAGLTQFYSNGPVEAQVHKLKLVKRQMFGRAKLPLLRQRLLHAV